VSKKRKNNLELKTLYRRFKKNIKNRINELKHNFNNPDKMLKEFVFCLLTPQSKAKVCWKAVEEIFEKNCVKDKGKLLNCLRGVRFKNNKANYILHNIFSFAQLRKYLTAEKDVFKLREFLVKNVKGYGYKEASHFLRNIGKGKDIAILDRHILKNLKIYGVIDKIPATLPKRKYLEIESKMRNFSKKIKIPMNELDFVLWAKETGEVFK